ncbi:MAG TPA: hypothetical protein VHK88_06225 [Aquihabitans sp.]|jgi:plastocyanin|nr:hypothetical protein [Aquihabitans sp.]
MHPTTTPVRPSRAVRRARRLAPLLLAVAVLAPACGDDGDDAAASKDGATTTEAPAPTAPTDADAAGGTLEVHAVDYAFEELPEKVKAGTKLTFVNDAEEELHELVAFRLPDEEKRSIEELLALPEEEAMKILGGGPPATVLMAMPGGEQINAVGDGTLSEPGRYIVMCSIPTGADGEKLLAAGPDGPPEPGPNDGPPHFVHGMHAELTVE